LWTADRWVRGGTAGSWPRLNETQASQTWQLIRFNGIDVAPIGCDLRYSLTIRG
jgi:hypothetical protein